MVLSISIVKVPVQLVRIAHSIRSLAALGASSLGGAIRRSSVTSAGDIVSSSSRRIARSCRCNGGTPSGGTVTTSICSCVACSSDQMRSNRPGTSTRQGRPPARSPMVTVNSRSGAAVSSAARRLLAASGPPIRSGCRRASAADQRPSPLSITARSPAVARGCSKPICTRGRQAGASEADRAGRELRLAGTRRTPQPSGSRLPQRMARPRRPGGPVARKGALPVARSAGVYHTLCSGHRTPPWHFTPRGIPVHRHEPAPPAQAAFWCGRTFAQRRRSGGSGTFTRGCAGGQGRPGGCGPPRPAWPGPALS